MYYRNDLSSALGLSALLHISVELIDIHTLGIVSDEVLAEIIGSQPEKVLAHISITMPLTGKEKEIKPLVRPYQRIRQRDRPSRMNIVIDISGDDKKASLQVLSDFRIFLDIVFKCDFSILIYYFQDTMMFFTPPSVVDVILVVA